MTSVMRLRCLLVATVLLSLGACESPSETRYKMLLTVELDTPKGVRRGESVIEISLRRVYDPLSTGTCDGRAALSYRSKVIGEAVPIDIPGGRTIYALLATYTGTPADMFMKNAFVEGRGLINYNFCPDWIGVIGQKKLLATLTSPADLGVPNDPYRWTAIPVLAMFGQNADPRSIYVLDSRNLEASLGAGYALRRVTIAPTNDPVSEGITARLPWLASAPPVRLEPYNLPPKKVMSEPERILSSQSLKSPGPEERP